MVLIILAGCFSISSRIGPPWGSTDGRLRPQSMRLVLTLGVTVLARLFRPIVSVLFVVVTRNVRRGAS